jgi:CRISPR-associated protein Csm1
LLKGDIDNLGQLFAVTLGERATFASWAALSRRISSFFSIVVPHLCVSDPRFSDIYTIFAGGDDFYFIGPWNAVKEFASVLHAEFSLYCAENPEIHFSAAYLMAKPGHPIRSFTETAEHGLELAKGKPGKNALHIAARENGAVINWTEFAQWRQLSNQISDAVRHFGLSTAFLYSMLELARMKESEKTVITNARWRSLLAYRTRRHIRDRLRLGDDAAKDAQSQLMELFAAKGIEKLGGRFVLVLSDHLYRERD